MSDREFTRREVFAICDAYESGMGHGIQKDGHSSGAIWGDPDCGMAYEIGYELGVERADDTLTPAPAISSLPPSPPRQPGGVSFCTDGGPPLRTYTQLKLDQDWDDANLPAEQAVELLPLPDHPIAAMWTLREEKVIESYARACIAITLANQLARTRHLERERDQARKDCAAIAARQAPTVAAKDEDGNNYCRILTILGMEEEGDPLAEVQRLFDADAAPEPTPESVRDAAELHRIKRAAACGTVDSFMLLPDSAKREIFAMAVEDSAARKLAEARLSFLHGTNTDADADGWEWGVARVRNVDGRVEYLWGASDHSDVDAAMSAQEKAQ